MNRDDWDAVHVHITSRTFAAKRPRRGELRFWLMTSAGMLLALVVLSVAVVLLSP